MSNLQEAVFTRSLTNADSPFQITEDDGIQKASIKCTSLTACQITGTKSIRGTTSNAVSLSQNQVLNLSAEKGILQFTITIPVGATCELVAT